MAEAKRQKLAAAGQSAASSSKAAAGACEDLLSPAVIKRVQRLNVNLDEPIELKLCAASLAELSAADALKILDHLEACGDAVNNPTVWIIERMGKQGGGAKAAAKAAAKGDSATLQVKQLHKLGKKLEKIVDKHAKGKGGGWKGKEKGGNGAGDDSRGKGKSSCKGGKGGGPGERPPESCKGGKGGSPGERPPLNEEDRRVLRKVAEVNRNAGLIEPLKFARVKPFLDILPSLRAKLDILDELASRAAQVSDPERWLSVSCAKNVASKGASKSKGGAEGKGKGGKGKPLDGRPTVRRAQPGPQPERKRARAQVQDNDDEFETLWEENEAEEAF